MEKHNVTIENREKITVTAVESIGTFDEGEVCAELTEGRIVIKGKGLNIRLLDLEKGVTVIDGEVDSVTYGGKKSEGSFMRKLLK